MKTLAIPVPEGLPQALKRRPEFVEGMSDEEFRQEARRMLAVKLYERCPEPVEGLGRISAGVAAQLLGTDRLTFLALLSQYGARAINLKDEEVSHEI